ncbi:MAG: hypothetical protein AB1553_12085 [Nitrospirota bacterium]
MVSKTNKKTKTAAKQASTAKQVPLPKQRSAAKQGLMPKHVSKKDHDKQQKLPPPGPTVAEKFPKVAGMVIHMTYYQKGANPVLMVRTVNVFPWSQLNFHMACMIKDCEGGGFDLTPIITSMLKGRKKVGKGTLQCKGKNKALPKDHASIDYDIAIKYKP